eukprot:5387202-Ditylum_brightwellii.AAC.1
MAFLANKKQSVRLSGAGAVHQNAVAKKVMQTVTVMASTMLIHASMKNPAGTIAANHWPMAMDYATWVYNNIPKKIVDFFLMSYGQGPSTALHKKH